MQPEPTAFAQAGWLGTVVLVVLVVVALTVFAAQVYAKRRAKRELPGGAEPEAREQVLPTAQGVAPADTPLSPAKVGAVIGAQAREAVGPGARDAVAEPRGDQSAPRDLLTRSARQTKETAQTSPAGSPVSAGTALIFPSQGIDVRLARGSDRRTRYPVVFAHGFLGFDSIEVRGIRHEYFRGISRQLQRPDTEGYLLRVAPIAGIAARAQQLAEQIRRLPVERVNIVAHSMGGLDARYAISELGLSGIVASLTTIGTPHWGTPLADLSNSLFGRLSPIAALVDLTTAKMTEFNRRYANVPGVEYRCFVSSVKGGATHVPTLLLPGYLWLNWRAGDNDGLVPVASQRWGELMGHIDADHWGQIGWSRRFDAAAFYEGLVDRLGDQGF